MSLPQSVKFDPGGFQCLKHVKAEMKGTHTKASYIASLTDEQLQKVFECRYKPGDHVISSFKIEKEKLRILVSFLFSGYLQATKFAHEMERVLTELIPAMHMEGSPSRLIAMFFNSINHYATCPDCEVLMADKQASDTQFVELQTEFMDFVGDLAKDASKFLPREQADFLIDQMTRYRDQVDNLVLKHVFLGVTVAVRQFYSVITGSPYTKSNNTVNIKGQFDFTRRVLTHLKLWAERQAIPYRGQEITHDMIQGDDMFANLHDPFTRLFVLKAFELMNCRFKDVQSPGGVKNGIYLQTAVDEEGFCRILPRAINTFMREYPHVEPTVAQICLLNISNYTKAISRGAGMHIVRFVDLALQEMFKGGPNFISFLKISSAKGGLGISYYEGGWYPEHSCSPSNFKDFNNRPSIPVQDCLKQFPAAAKLLNIENAFYNAYDVVIPQSRIRSVCQLAASTIHWDGTSVSKQQQIRSMNYYISTLKPAPPCKNMHQTSRKYVLTCIRDIWDPAYERMRKGEIVRFGNNDAIRNTYKIAAGTCFYDFSAFFSFIETVFAYRFPGEKLTCEFILSFSKGILKPEGYAVLEEICQATSVGSGMSKFLLEIANASGEGAANYLLNTRDAHKFASVSELRDYSGPTCNMIHPSIDEIMRTVMMDFAKHIAWQGILKWCPDTSDEDIKLSTPATRLMLDRTRPVRHYTVLVREALNLLQEYRQGDLCVMGKQRRAIQLGTLRIPFDPCIAMGDNWAEAFGLSLSSDGSLKSTYVNPAMYVGSGEIPKNKVLDISLSVPITVPKIRTNRIVKRVEPNLDPFAYGGVLSEV